MNYLTNSELLRAIMNEPHSTSAERLLASRLWDAMEENRELESDMRAIKTAIDNVYEVLPE